MAAVNATFQGMFYDRISRTYYENATMVGIFFLTDYAPGHPLPPEGSGKPPGQPPGIWGGPIDPYPDHGLPGRPPGTWGGANEPFPTPPIHLPPNVPPPENVPQPGDPPVALPGNWPVQPITPPPFVVINYPGVGPIVVAPPAS